MKIGFLSSSGKDHHSPADWADASAGMIADLIDIDEKSTSDAAVTARRVKERLAPDLADALTAIHQRVRDHVNDKITQHGMERLSHPLEPELDHVQDALAGVNAVLAKTPYAAHFANPVVQAEIVARLEMDFRSVDDIARSWHADRNPNHPDAKAYRAAREAHGPSLVHSAIENFRGA